jgi:hypothetical protein
MISPAVCVRAHQPIKFLVSLKEEEEHDLDVTGRNFTLVTPSYSYALEGIFYFIYLTYWRFFPLCSR